KRKGLYLWGTLPTCPTGALEPGSVFHSPSAACCSYNASIAYHYRPGPPQPADRDRPALPPLCLSRRGRNRREFTPTTTAVSSRPRAHGPVTGVLPHHAATSPLLRLPPLRRPRCCPGSAAAVRSATRRRPGSGRCQGPGQLHQRRCPHPQGELLRLPR